MSKKFSMSSTRDEPKTGVFWDVEDFPIPVGLNPVTMYDNIRKTLANKDYPGEVFIWAYLPDHSQLREYENAGINTILFQGDKYARLNKILSDILLWSLDNPAHYPNGPNVLVISKDMEDKDTNFVSVLEALEERYYKVLLALPDKVTPEVTLNLPWSSLSNSGGDPIDQKESLQRIVEKWKAIERIVVTTDDATF